MQHTSLNGREVEVDLVGRNRLRISELSERDSTISMVHTNSANRVFVVEVVDLFRGLITTG